MRLDTRAGSSESDLAEARIIAAAAEEHDGASPVSDQALLAAAQHERRLLLFTEQGAQDPAAFGIVGQGEVDLVVRPDARGRGIGSAALAALLDDAPRDTELLSWAHGVNSAAEALLSRHGFQPVRTLLRMALDPAELPRGGDPLAIATPDGLTLHAFDPDRPEDAGVWVRANAAAFATHPEQGRITEADFALIREETWFDPADLILLVATEGPSAGEAAGSTWIKTVRDGEVETELYAVGVRPEYAGAGLGRLLLDVTLARMAQHEPSRVTLYVDGENERAVRMYERAGFTVDSRSRQWRRAPMSEPGATMDA
ncbi:mycothiol synthase [Leucobacter sp. USHLN153]|uniref:mycothiol synthase n=1 Tax=Leucobacter sp. USHLN153 TaxID=3081268 RepID=UPI00301A77CD